ncbi:nitrous oxide reductase accessory protein NosL [Sphaerobacter sp.]|uniref:nitrous oxide reductase accessory protein NosL n=1 Tax=Sphaerobacter sp. TaxID=2099654 RepID=UPI001DE1C924|nr:nitrous oxide reductase accessory protein NosL [Sphaerobacter sp.]MBX5445554.1 nitrous oxide reductase accessory protein NosL [Sphaerobacter sp.]
MRRLHWLVLLLLGSVLLVGCGGNDPDKPPEIAYGRDTCARCGMIISEERHAAGLVDASGKQDVFDDAGEMVAFVQEHGLGDRRVWVHDFDSQEWIDGTTAFYVASPDATTPMGTGLVAFATRESAEAYSRDHAGTVMTWDEVLSSWTPPMDH